MLYFVEDAAGSISLVVNHNNFAQDDGSAKGKGRANLFISAPDLAGQGTTVQIFDDRSARNESRPGVWYGVCANIRNDCHSWDSSLGLGYFSWTWVRPPPCHVTCDCLCALNSLQRPFGVPAVRRRPDFANVLLRRC